MTVVHAFATIRPLRGQRDTVRAVLEGILARTRAATDAAGSG